MIFLSPTNTISRLVEENPRYMKVLDRFHVDYGFAGSLTLTEACFRHGLDLQELLVQLRETDREAAFLDDAVLEGFEHPELVEYVLLTHHHFLEREIPRLEDLFEQALQTSGEAHPEILEWRALFRRFRGPLERHMKKEGRDLYPFCLSPAPDLSLEEWRLEVDRRLEEMERVDQEALGEFQRLRKRTESFWVPGDATPALRYLLYDLSRLEGEVKRHFRVEQEILFPKLRSAHPPTVRSREAKPFPPI